MAALVDRQNRHDPHDLKMYPDFDNSIAFQASLDLVLKGKQNAKGYTVTILHSGRREAKNKMTKKRGH